MPLSFCVLIGFQLLGEILHRAFHVPLPGPVIGMFLLAALLVHRQRNRANEEPAVQPSLVRTANALVANLGLLFVPAGVGVMTQTDVLRHQWLPIAAGVVGSTLTSLIVTGLVLQHVGRIRAAGAADRARHEVLT